MMYFEKSIILGKNLPVEYTDEAQRSWEPRPGQSEVDLDFAGLRRLSAFDICNPISKYVNG